MSSSVARKVDMSSEDRISKIESDVSHILSVLVEMKADNKSLRGEVHGLRVEFYSFREEVAKEFGLFREAVAKEFGLVRKEFGSFQESVAKEFGLVRKEFGSFQESVAKEFGSVRKENASFQESVAKEFGSVREEIAKVHTSIERAKVWIMVGVAGILISIVAHAFKLL